VLADDVFEAITALVMDHVVEPGARLSIDGLAARLGVSPTPVREALARLEALGLASKEPLRGYRATALLSRAELDDLFEFRLLVEPWAAGRAAGRGEAAETLLTLLAEMDGAPPEGYARYRALAEHDRRFHDTVLALAGNEHARQAFARTHCHLHIFRLHYDRDIGPEVLTEHRTLVEAITSGDQAAAEAAMTRHIENSMTLRLRRIYE
jgi:DNA-binding GntR family transcriptional regulator